MSYRDAIIAFSEALSAVKDRILTGEGDTEVFDDLRDLSDVEAVRKKFDRSAEESQYHAARGNTDDPGQLKKLYAAKLRSDGLSSLERSFVRKRRTRIACLAAEASSKRFQGQRLRLVMDHLPASIES